MLNAKNIVILTCGIVADPEMVHENIAKFRVAMDYAGDEKNSDNKSGYFDVTYFFNEGDRNSDFVRGQITNGNLKKGSQIQLVGSLRQSRWKNAEDGTSRSMVDVRADSITYASSGAKKDDNATTGGGAEGKATPVASVPDEF
jgi:single-stranded DNA-binding protein